jgi:hypothetical protein
MQKHLKAVEVWAGITQSVRGSNPGGELRFSAPVQTGPRSLSQGLKLPVHSVDHLPPSNAEVNEREEPYFYPPHPLGFRGLFYGELYVYMFLCVFSLKMTHVGRNMVLQLVLNTISYVVVTLYQERDDHLKEEVRLSEVKLSVEIFR